MATIECKDLYKTYGQVHALNGLDLSISGHGVFGFLGPNGAGKTTTMKILTGLIRRTGGECRVNGVDVNESSSDHRLHIGYLSQNPTYYHWMTGRELLNFVADIFGFTASEKKSRTETLLELAGLSKAANRKIGGYSGGMVQRLGIAQAMYHNPEVLFLDEPVSSLDPIGRKEVLDFIKALKDNTTVFMSTHILADVERVCDEVAIVDSGKVVAYGNTQKLMERYSSGYCRFAFENPEDALKFSDLLENRKIQSNCSGESVRIKNLDFISNRSLILGETAEHKLSLIDISQDSATLEDVFIHFVQGAGHGK